MRAVGLGAVGGSDAGLRRFGLDGSIEGSKELPILFFLGGGGGPYFHCKTTYPKSLFKLLRPLY